MSPSVRILVWSSFCAWGLAALVLALTLWQDANYSASRDDVAAGLAGLGFTIGVGIFVVSAFIGVVLGIVAARRAPDHRPADIALGLNVVTLVGVLASVLLLVAL